jgi:hypothetical protein
MPVKLDKIGQKKRQRLLIAIAVGALVILFLASMLHIGAGEAEWAGMTVSDLTPILAIEHNIPKNEHGVVINWVEEQAYYSGVKEGDLLKSINNIKLDTVSDFLSVAKGINIGDGVLLDILRDRKPLYITLKNRLGLHGLMKEALGISPVAMTNAIPIEAGRLPTPKEQRASKKILVEGHWLGIELIPLTPELSKEYNVGLDIKGLLVDEISLEGAESGILAGDMIVAVERAATPNLVAFTEATRRVKNRNKAEVLVSRRGRLLKFEVSSERALGFSQNEAAQPIVPGAISPHRIRSKPCTACHIIMRTGGQLPTDAGDILPNPPPITKGSTPPHEYRGACKDCHVILRDRRAN